MTARRGFLGGAERDELGDNFEDREHELLQVAAIEKSLGLDDLGRFTPPG